MATCPAVERPFVHLNLDFASMPKLRRITLAIELQGGLDRELRYFSYNAPWTLPAKTVAVLHKRPVNAPVLGYIELQLDLYPYSLMHEGEAQMDEARCMFAQHRPCPIIEHAGVELGPLVDDGLLESVRVWTTVLAPSLTFQAHSCLNDCIVDVFPALYAKRHLCLGEGYCRCDCPGLLHSSCALPKMQSP